MQKYFPKTNADKFAVGFFAIGGHLLLWYQAWVVLPYYFPTDYWTSPHILTQWIIAVLFYLNVFGNLVQMIIHRSELLPSMVHSSPDMSTVDRVHSMEERGWHYCTQCLHYAPPRSHHCKLCNVCVLRRDHHCWFAGQCVGYLNHRYYMCVILYAWLTAGYVLWFNSQFIGETLYGSYSLWTMFCISLPHAAAVFGLLSVFQFCVSTMAFMTHFFFFMLSWMFYIQLKQLLDGQTQFEKNTKILSYQRSRIENIRDILGDYWYLVWLCPLIPSILPGDGMLFKLTNIGGNNHNHNAEKHE